ncbi:LysR family transcriptional regulator [Pseudonocardia nematodicida]|uniref:LysR family transcriptional regulator n=1 Tax=Pseudonocardia nematodicida TaxID=1206997 RepID=A0ABV1KE58_9PSEU
MVIELRTLNRHLRSNQPMFSMFVIGPSDIVPGMQLRELALFLAVVDSGSFQAAAERSFCSQSTVSEAVHALERSLGVDLFDRSHRPARLTHSGEVLAADARRLVAFAAETRDRVRADSDGVIGSVRVGTYAIATTNFLADLLPRLRADHPLLDVTLVETGGADLPGVAENGQVDCFLRQTTPPLPATRFETRPLWREPFLVVAPPDHPVARRPGPVRPSDLATLDLIVTGRFKPAGLLAHPFWSSMGATNVAYEVSHPHSLVALVRAGLGVGVSTLLGVRTADTTGLHIAGIADTTAVRDVSLFVPRFTPPTRQTRFFVDYASGVAPPSGCSLLGDQGSESR